MPEHFLAPLDSGHTGLRIDIHCHRRPVVTRLPDRVEQGFRCPIVQGSTTVERYARDQEILFLLHSGKARQSSHQRISACLNTFGSDSGSVERKAITRSFGFVRQETNDWMEAMDDLLTGPGLVGDPVSETATLRLTESKTGLPNQILPPHELVQLRSEVGAQADVERIGITMRSDEPTTRNVSE